MDKRQNRQSPLLPEEGWKTFRLTGWWEQQVARTLNPTPRPRHPLTRAVQPRLLRLSLSVKFLLNLTLLPMNTLYYGDNLKILRDYIKDESVDLIYLDPPFNSNRNYNVLFRNESGSDSESQISAFEDTWHWNLAAEQTYSELINEPDQVGRMIESFRRFIGNNQMMAYLVMMAVRLKELHRVLKPTGSLYLHCHPTASHYLQLCCEKVRNGLFSRLLTLNDSG
jgi:hypothetical protein